MTGEHHQGTAAIEARNLCGTSVPGMEVVPVNTADLLTTRAYVDNQGDIWAFRPRLTRGVWSYIGPQGVLTNWDVYAQPPEEYEPYIELSEQSSAAIISKLTKEN